MITMNNAVPPQVFMTMLNNSDGCMVKRKRTSDIICGDTRFSQDLSDKNWYVDNGNVVEILSYDELRTAEIYRVARYSWVIETEDDTLTIWLYKIMSNGE